jgi:hypothetical protein
MSRNPEVPEADALEQEQTVGTEDSDLPSVPTVLSTLEVPEADALDQAREVPDDDDHR